MATKKKKTKKTKNKQTGSKKLIKPKRAASAKAQAKKRLTAKKSAPKKPAARTKGITKTTAGASKNKKKTSGIQSARAASRRAPNRNPRRTDASFRQTEFDSDSAGQSGDLQGLSNVERADSESVDELIDEGNAFEAGVISGVEEADDEDGREVHTHEVPEDDVPGEYLDED
jgi:hypothetical protein